MHQILCLLLTHRTCPTKTESHILSIKPTKTRWLQTSLFRVPTKGVRVVLSCLTKTKHMSFNDLKQTIKDVFLTVTSQFPIAHHKAWISHKVKHVVKCRQMKDIFDLFIMYPRNTLVIPVYRTQSGGYTSAPRSLKQPQKDLVVDSRIDQDFFNVVKAKLLGSTQADFVVKITKAEDAKVERAAYRAIGSHPNVARFITEFTCIDNMKRLDATKKFCEPTPNKKNKLLNHMVFEHIHLGKNIDEHIDTNPKHVNSAFMQCVLALCEFYQKGVCHGDIASDNILVSPANDMSSVTYTVDGTRIRIKTQGYVVKFIDFEMANVKRPSFREFVFDLTVLTDFFVRWTSGSKNIARIDRAIRSCKTLADIIDVITTRQKT